LPVLGTILPQVSIANPECVLFRHLARQHDIKFIADVTVQGASGANLDFADWKGPRLDAKVDLLPSTE
jgi:hypothetical protein